MAFRYTLRLKDGSDVGEVELGHPAGAGDEIRLNGERDMRVFAVVAAGRMGEFVDRQRHRYGFLVVEPIDD